MNLKFLKKKTQASHLSKIEIKGETQNENNT
jgi:hypothetical protein